LVAGEDVVQEPVLYSSSTTVITPSVARFGNVSYQIANIGSVGTSVRRKSSAMAIWLVLASLLTFAAAAAMYQESLQYSLGIAFVGLLLLVMGIAWQNKRPALEYRIFLKTSSNDVEEIVTRDGTEAAQLKNAIEEAFAWRTPVIQTEA
jgi:hypothetical protein